MTPKRKKRILLIGLMLAGVSIAAAFTLKAFNENLMYFYTPSKVAAGEAPVDRLIRIGGLVSENSLVRTSDGITLTFDVTDNSETITVQYTGILPDLFREGQGIIAHGKLQENRLFIADEVLAKHDENYMPPEVAAALESASKSNANTVNSD